MNWPGVALALSLTATMPTLSLAQVAKDRRDAFPAWMFGTVSVEHSTLMRDGEFDGCSLTYMAYVRDHTYRSGAPAAVTGSLSAVGVGNGIGTMLKVVVNDVSFHGGKLTLTPAVPNAAYLRTKAGKSNAKSRVSSSSSDTPGALVTIFPFDEAMLEILEGIFDRSELIVAFNRKKGGLDVSVPIDVRVSNTDERGNRERSDQMVDDFASCMGRLLRR